MMIKDQVAEPAEEIVQISHKDLCESGSMFTAVCLKYNST